MADLLAIPVLALDGPSGTGKGTVGNRIARMRGWNLLDSGALYRAFAFAANEYGISPDDVGGLQSLNRRVTLEFIRTDLGEVEILVDSQNVSDILRGERGGRLASRYAAVPEVRAVLMKRQRSEQREPGLVADGRDMGTVVFPDAVLKVFLTANSEIRAKRRYNQLKEKDFDVNLRRLDIEIAERDRCDANRAVAPLEPAADAVILDTSRRSSEEVVEEVDKLLTVRLQELN